MFLPLYSLILLLLGHAVAAWRWLLFVPAEVAKNDADITANGAQDSLSKAYHARRTRIRGAVAVALLVLAHLPLLVLRWLGYHVSAAAIALGAVALLVLLATYFARYFTPLLNLARAASGRTDITEWYASPDSASWPDAAVWKQVRAEAPLMPADRLQGYANMRLAQLLTRTYRLGLTYYALLLAGAGVLLFLK